MAKWLLLGLPVQIALMVVSGMALGGSFGPSPGAAVAAGAVVMAALALPSLALLSWGRSRSNRAFLLSVGGVILGKMALVGGALYAWLQSGLPRLEFALGLMAAWVVSFALQSAVLRRGARVRVAS